MHLPAYERFIQRILDLPKNLEENAAKPDAWRERSDWEGIMNAIFILEKGLAHDEKSIKEIIQNPQGQLEHIIDILDDAAQHAELEARAARSTALGKTVEKWTDDAARIKQFRGVCNQKRWPLTLPALSVLL